MHISESSIGKSGSDRIYCTVTGDYLITTLTVMIHDMMSQLQGVSFPHAVFINPTLAAGCYHSLSWANSYFALFAHTPVNRVGHQDCMLSDPCTFE